MNEANDFQATKGTATTEGAPPVVCSAIVRPFIVVGFCWVLIHGWVMVPGCRWWLSNHLELALTAAAVSTLLVRWVAEWAWKWGKPWNSKEQSRSRLSLVTLALLILWVVRDYVETTMHQCQPQYSELSATSRENVVSRQSVQLVRRKAPRTQ